MAVGWGKGGGLGPRFNFLSTQKSRGHPRQHLFFFFFFFSYRPFSCASAHSMLLENFEDFATRSIQLYERAPLHTRFTTKYRHADGHHLRDSLGFPLCRRL